MGYVDQNLMNGETVIYRGRFHWIAFWGAGVCVLLAGEPSLRVFAIMLGAVLGLHAWVYVRSSEFAVTNKRVIAKTGVVRRESFEVLLNKVEGITVDQGIFGRIFDYGTIIVNGTGGSKPGVHKVASPFVLRRQIQEQIDQRAEPVSAPRPEVAVG